MPTVSLIVPCYNVEKVCDRFFESLLAQTFTDIQLIVVNDGSTDGTEEKVLSYKERLENMGYKVDYVYQENKGLGGAINTGLKHVSGEYLCWADSDDYYENNAFEVRVDYFSKHPNCVVLTCDAYCRNIKTLDKYTLIGVNYPQREDKKQFDLLLDGRSVFCSGCHMIKLEAFKQANPQMSIYGAKRGQNWQLLLPVYFKFDRDYLSVPVYNYIKYEQSMSSGDNTKELELFRYSEHETILNETLRHIEETNQCDMHKYYSFVKDKYLKLRLVVALKYNDKKLFEETYLQKQKETGIDLQDRFFKFRLKHRIFNRIFNKVRG